MLRQSNGQLYGNQREGERGGRGGGGGGGGGDDDDKILKIFVRDHCNTGRNDFRISCNSRTRTNSEHTRSSVCSDDIHEEISF